MEFFITSISLYDYSRLSSFSNRKQTLFIRPIHCNTHKISDIDFGLNIGTQIFGKIKSLHLSFPLYACATRRITSSLE